MKRGSSVPVIPYMRGFSTRRWIGRIALCLSLIVVLGLPVQAVADGSTTNGSTADGSGYVTAGKKAFDAGFNKGAWAYFLKAKKEGSTEAIYWLGHMTELGLATKKDLPKAIAYFRQAAKAGLPVAQAKLGHSYLDGNGVIQDFAKARKWLEQAANNNVPAAQFDLGRVYEKGLGVTKNPVLAYVWFDFAARGGDPQYRKARDGALKVLKPDEIIQAQKSAESMRSSIFGAAAGGN